ncbi:cytochrome P450 2 sub U member 1 [Bulinus truncatus]|nr:cytochrome P450 2 sub U member 1 [Bulinus truncatus]
MSARLPTERSRVQTCELFLSLEPKASFWNLLTTSSVEMSKDSPSYYEATVLLSVLLLPLLVIYLWSRRPKNLPPSPGIALPVVGHLYLLEKNPRKQLKQWADKYGDAFTLQMGSRITVYINTFEAMKEAFVKKADYFSDRNEDNILARHVPNVTKGVISSSGANWKSQRTTSLSILRNFGMGKNMLAEKIMEEVLCCTEELARKGGQPSNVRHLTNMSVSNVICSIIFGRRFEFDDPKFIKMMDLFNEILKSNAAISVLTFFPFLYYLPFDLFGGKQLIDIFSQSRIFNLKMINEIKKQSNANNVDNYILAYIDAMKKEQQSGEMSYLDEINLSRNIDGLFIAGSETTSTTILWCLLHVLNYPDVQEKIFHEIKEQIGTERLPKISDKPKMKYLTAFTMEVQRIASIVPLSISHLCNTDTTVAGYTIPKGSIVMPNLDAVLRSKEIWGDPETFRPERFLDEQGNIVKREELIPFSIGRRVCLGESLAKMELFLYLSTLFQRFEFLPATPDKVPPLTETFGLVAAPEPFEIRCRERIK